MNNSTIFSSSIEPTVGTVQTLSYKDDGSQWEVAIPSRRDDSHVITATDDVSLENFLSRPIFLPAQTWTPGVTGFAYQFSPWSLFFANKRVVNRLNNYRLLSCDLCVKFMINGNGFYYGRIMADYKFAATSDFVCFDDGTVTGEAIPASQRMHLFIDPMTSQGGTMRIPFFSLKNAFGVPEGDWALSVPGLLTLRELNPLKHANGASTPVEIVISMWAENVHLSVPTSSSAYQLTAQAGEEPGPVSRVASAVADAASMLRKVPTIGPYATAASMAASGLGALARQFGFSRPVILEPAKAIRPSYVGDVCHADEGENVMKLSLDSKQGLTVDPGVIGIDTGDEMSIPYLLSKESYLTTFPWLVSGTTDTLLWNARVTPCIYTSLSSVLWMPACCFASMPFEYWRGCMKFRFQIVASQFHKGRLKLCWDPVIVAAAPEANTEYTRVVDISTERDVTVTVRWGQAVTWLKTSPLASANHTTGRLTSITADAHNGVFSVFVLNSLTTPNSVANNDIGVNVFVSMEDGELAVPTDDNFKRLYGPYSITVQSGEYELQAGDEEVTDANNDPEPAQSTERDIGACDTVSRQNLIYMGEVFSSFRTLLKRYSFYRTDLCPNSANLALWTLRHPNFPSFRGYANYSLDTSGTGKKMNYVAQTLLTYLLPAFTVARGGIRWKAVLYTAAPNEILSPLVVERGVASSTPYANTTTSFTAIGTTSGYVADSNATLRSCMNKGAALTLPTLQPCVEFETPFYSMYRGVYTRDVRGNTSDTSMYGAQHQYQVTTTGTTPKYLDRYVSTGEDFQLLLFQGCPGYTLNPVFPVPA